MPQETANASTAAIAELTAAEGAALLRDSSLTAEAWATALLDVARANRDLNAFTYLDEGRVLEAARRADSVRSLGEPSLLLAGVPMIVKDNIDTLGFATSAATAALKTSYPERNAPVVAALLRAGAYVFGKANMHEMAGGGTSSNPTFGAVGNPYDRTRVAGGSSGGTAAAIAARMVPVGLGTDTAGSVRIPSAFCGTVGLRPTTIGGERYPLDGVVPLSFDLDTIGPMARTVADLALLHSAIIGAPQPVVSSLAGVRIGISTTHYWENLDGGVADVANAALQQLKAAGAVLVEVDVGTYLNDAGEAFWTLINAGFRDDLAVFFKRQGIRRTAEAVIDAIASRDTLRLFQLAREAPLTTELIDAARGAVRERVRSAYAEMFKSHGIAAIAYPTEPLVAPKIAVDGDRFEDEVMVGGRATSKVGILIHNTRFTCALGVPGLSLAAGLTAEGLPVGLEFDGLAGDDVALLGLGMAAEKVLGRLPPPKLRVG
jgi:indoleacetamide hydrolase